MINIFESQLFNTLRNVKDAGEISTYFFKGLYWIVAILFSAANGAIALKFKMNPMSTFFNGDTMPAIALFLLFFFPTLLICILFRHLTIAYLCSANLYWLAYDMMSTIEHLQNDIYAKRMKRNLRQIMFHMKKTRLTSTSHYQQIESFYNQLLNVDDNTILDKQLANRIKSYLKMTVNQIGQLSSGKQPYFSNGLKDNPHVD